MSDPTAVMLYLQQERDPDMRDVNKARVRARVAKHRKSVTDHVTDHSPAPDLQQPDPPAGVNTGWSDNTPEAADHRERHVRAWLAGAVSADRPERARTQRPTRALRNFPASGLKHGTRTCLCRGCGRTYTGVSAFDSHRMGEISAGRRCGTDAEMAAVGLRPNEHGHFGMPSGPSQGDLADDFTDEQYESGPSVGVAY
jgi:hypothetical protein